MKHRTSFVSNSSSSSFVIDRYYVSPFQMNQLRTHSRLAGKYDTWEIKETEATLECYTSMDNFNLREFCRRIGIPDEAITQEEQL